MTKRTGSLFSQTIGDDQKSLPGNEDLDYEPEIPEDISTLGAQNMAKNAEVIESLQSGLDKLAEWKASKGVSGSAAPVSSGGSDSTKGPEQAAVITHNPPQMEKPRTEPQGNTPITAKPAGRSRVGEIPEPYPGAGKGISKQFEEAWPGLKEKVDKLPLMQVSILQNLGPLELETDHGKVIIPPYFQLLANFAARYYANTIKAEFSELALKSIASSYRGLMRGKLDTADVEIANFANNVLQLNIGHWVQIVGMVMFDEQDIESPGEIENFTRQDFIAGVDQLNTIYPDAGMLCAVLSVLSKHGPAAISPIADYLMYDEEMAMYINKYCKGVLKGSEMAVVVEQRAASGSSYESAVDQFESSQKDMEGESVLDPTEGLVAHESRDVRSSVRASLGISTKSGYIDLEEEHASNLEGKGRDTSKFTQALNFNGLRDQMLKLETGQTELIQLVQALTDKFEYLSKKQEQVEAATASVLGDICSSLTVLISQRSLAGLKDTTDDLNESFQSHSAAQAPFQFKISTSGDDKGKGKAESSGEGDIVDRLLKFQKSDAPQLVRDLKSMLINAGQAAMADQMSEALLLKDSVRINLANNVKKFKSFF